MSATQYAANMPAPSAPFVNPETGLVTQQWYHYLLQLFSRTGGTLGTSSSSALATALAALAAAQAAQGTATVASLAADLALVEDDPEAAPKRPDPVLFALMLEG